MKTISKTLAIIASLAFIFAGCGTNQGKKESATEMENAQIQRIDSVTNQIDSIKSAIESSSNEVDELLNDL